METHVNAGRVLIVDDEAANRKLVRAALEAKGYSITEAANGNEALASIAINPPDLVLLDIQMPVCDGYEALRRLKGSNLTRLIPVVMLTGMGELCSKIRAVEVGADGYLVKPFNLAELCALVKSLVSLKRYTDEMEHVTTVLHSMARIVEHRDAYTGNHCDRVGFLASSVADKMGFGPEHLKTLSLAGSFHDLGKIAIPDAILRKTGRLTGAEFDIMKTHSAIGAGLVRPLRSLAAVVPLIHHHHERLDGSGYPDGLSGSRVPMIVRILTVSDIYDALATERPYKKALPPDTCMKTLRNEAERGWWDRDVVEVLAGIITAGAMELTSVAAPENAPADFVRNRIPGRGSE